MRHLKRLLLLGAFTLVSATSAMAVAGPVETAVTTAIGEAKTAADNVLIAAVAIVGGFIVFKLVKRAANKA